VNPDVNSGVPKVEHPEDYLLLVSVLNDASDDDTARNEVANLLQRSKYPRLADALCKVLDNPAEKPRFRSFVAQHLGLLAAGEDAVQREEAKAKLHECLSDRHVEVRREALLALVRVKDPQAAKLAVELLNSAALEAGATRDLAIRCVHDLDLRDQIPAVRKYVRHPDNVIRIAAIVALSQWGDEESRPAFEEAAQSKTVRLQRAGKAAMERLDAQKVPVEQPAPKE
jgi:HEAT repeat protein